MKTRLIFLCILFHAIVHAKHVNQLYYPAYTLKQQDQIAHIDFFKSLFPQLNTEGLSLALKFKKFTKHTAHYDYSILFHQLPISQASLKLNTTLDGKVLSIKVEHEDLSILSTNDILTQLQAWQNVNLDNWIPLHVNEANSIKQTELVILYQQGKPNVVLELDRWNTTIDQLDYVAIDGQILQSFDRTRSVKIDTIVN